VLKTVFEETVFHVPDKQDQMSLRKMIDFLLSMVSFTKTDQSRLISQMRQEVEELQRKVKQGQLFYDDFKRQRETIASHEKLIASLRSQLTAQQQV
jgi:septal ring factor EnvC (AmiA/AmiB activator)